MNTDVWNDQYVEISDVRAFVQSGQPLVDVSPESPMDFVAGYSLFVPVAPRAGHRARNALPGRLAVKRLDGRRSLRRTAEITLELPREQAMALFTAEGERSWAEGWEPHYPEPGRRDGPGAVFTTAHGDHQTTWIMVDHQSERVRYARVTDGMTAGTVAVDVIASGEQFTRIRVSYDLTALSTAGETWLAAFGAAYESEIASWATDIGRAVQRRSGVGPHRS